MKKIVFLLFFTIVTHSQIGKEISYGFYAGAVYSKMNNIQNTIIPPNIYTNFSTTEKDKFGALAGVFLNWKYPRANISFQPEIFYSRQATDFNYNDNKGLNYQIKFDYHNLNLGFLFKYYIHEGLYLGIGPNVALNLNRNNISYTSNGAEMEQKYGVSFTPDPIVQKTLKESLEGTDYFQGIFGIGYEFQNKLVLGFRYHLGLTDALETKENGHRFIDNNNKTNAFSLHIGYKFDFDDSNNF
ncbi:MULTISPECIES: outer membrane beta-barrel protein [Flavobacterium]|uniref:PorT family protein n=1 Tax=Flavobacterium columnare TaxID=996 RepID=A0AA94F6E3_9FLAO|nr:outer membrane beta-barrel protein [Flavobacterium columnare]MCH4828438.1 PorT family protein [Flavobacterium columnare]MCH4832267.1 PorT family protein [Flavobacterium columnare]